VRVRERKTPLGIALNDYTDQPGAPLYSTIPAGWGSKASCRIPGALARRADTRRLLRP
jgi:hypothetical protein